jgi:hypothetical protein
MAIVLNVGFESRRTGCKENKVQVKKQAIGGQAVDSDNLRAPLLLCPLMPLLGGLSTHSIKPPILIPTKRLELSSGESWDLSGIFKMTLIHIGKSSLSSPFPTRLTNSQSSSNSSPLQQHYRNQHS